MKDQMAEELRLARRANKIAAIVADTMATNVLGVSEERGDQAVPVDVVLLMLQGVLAALAGETDWAALNGIHPDVTPLAYTRIQALLESEE